MYTGLLAGLFERHDMIVTRRSRCKFYVVILLCADKIFYSTCVARATEEAAGGLGPLFPLPGAGASILPLNSLMVYVSRFSCTVCRLLSFSSCSILSLFVFSCYRRKRASTKRGFVCSLSANC